MEKRIYVADDEEHIRTLIKTFLENEGYQVESFSTGDSLMAAFLEKEPDLIILDIMMPGRDGLSICMEIRKRSAVPIIIVSAKDSPLDRVTGITLGSDDYLVKPFLPLELTARVKALFRRAELSRGREAGGQELAALVCGNLCLDSRSRDVTVDKKPFPVTPTEFDFLNYLMERLHTAVPKEELLREVWKCSAQLADTRMADDLVKRLRRKLKDAGSQASIDTVWGYGFRLSEKEETRS